MLGIFVKKGDPWEELYDAETNTYFYRNRGTGEFSRQNPSIVSVKSTHVETRATDPIWETLVDSENSLYWSDLETGRVAYSRPDRGTFVTEVPLRDFRLANKIAAKKSRAMSSRKSTNTIVTSRKSMRVVKRDDDFGIVTADSSDMDFEKLFGNASPAQFDAGAMYGVGLAVTPSSEATATPPTVDYRRLSTRDGGETPDFPLLDEEAVLAQSTIVTDNPLFRYGK